MKCARCGDDVVRMTADQRYCFQCAYEVTLITERDEVRRRGRGFPHPKDTTDLAMAL